MRHQRPPREILWARPENQLDFPRHDTGTRPAAIICATWSSPTLAHAKGGWREDDEPAGNATVSTPQDTHTVRFLQALQSALLPTCRPRPHSPEQVARDTPRPTLCDRHPDRSACRSDLATLKKCGPICATGKHAASVTMKSFKDRIRRGFSRRAHPGCTRRRHDEKERIEWLSASISTTRPRS